MWLGRRGARVLALFGLAAALGAGAAFDAVSAVAAKVHSRAVVPCSLLKTSEVSAAVHYQVKTSNVPSTPAFVPGGLFVTCNFVEAHPANIDNGARVVSLAVIQRDYSKKPATWTASAASKQFAHIKSFEAPVAVVHGLGDGAVWSPAIGALYVLSGDIVFEISGNTSQRTTGSKQAEASESVDIGLMRKALART